MERRLTITRASTALLIAGSIAAFVTLVLGVDLRLAGDLAAWGGLGGVVISSFGWRRRSVAPPSTPAAPAEQESAANEHARELIAAHADHRRRTQAVVNAGDGMVMVFQPIIDLRDGSRVGYEALARFADGRPANEWFDEAHAVGLGVELELMAISQALDEFDSVKGYLSINLSPPTLTSRQFFEFIVASTDPKRIVVELTEHAVIDDYTAIRSALEAVRDIGTKIAVDDAGGGISSMRHILTIAPDIIKLDRSLIATIDSDAARRALALSLAQFATEIGADLIAEGVERAAEMTACYESGIRYAQGYLLGRPGPLDTR